MSSKERRPIAEGFRPSAQMVFEFSPEQVTLLNDGHDDNNIVIGINYEPADVKPLTEVLQTYDLTDNERELIMMNVHEVMRMSILRAAINR